jgi:hypothetical protein
VFELTSREDGGAGAGRNGSAPGDEAQERLEGPPGEANPVSGQGTEDN